MKINRIISPILSQAVVVLLSLSFSFSFSFNLYSKSATSHPYIPKKNFTAPLSSSDSGRKNFYSYKQLLFSEADFERHVLSSVRTIVGDFFQGLSEFERNEALIVSLVQQNNQLENFLPPRPFRSYGNIQPFHLNLTLFLNEIRKIQMTIFKILKTPLERPSSSHLREANPSPAELSKYLTSNLTLPLIFDPTLEIEDDLTLLNIKIGILYQFLLHLNLSQNSTNFSGQDLDPIKELTSEINFITEKILIRSIPLKIRTEYHLVWHEFIKPLFKLNNSKISKELFLSNVEGYNFIWNNFYQKISKESLEVPSQSLSSFKRIDDEWNSIIRILVDIK